MVLFHIVSTCGENIGLVQSARESSFFCYLTAPLVLSWLWKCSFNSKCHSDETIFSLSSLFHFPSLFLTPLLLCRWACTMDMHHGSCHGGHKKETMWTSLLKGHGSAPPFPYGFFPRWLWKSQCDEWSREGALWLLITSCYVPGSLLDALHTFCYLILSMRVVNIIALSYRWNMIPGLGRSPGGGDGNPLQYSCLENPMNREAWQATVHGVTKRWTRLTLSLS